MYLTCLVCEEFSPPLSGYRWSNIVTVSSSHIVAFVKYSFFISHNHFATRATQMPFCEPHLPFICCHRPCQIRFCCLCTTRFLFYLPSYAVALVCKRISSRCFGTISYDLQPKTFNFQIHLYNF